jgi:hypothetical protein
MSYRTAGKQSGLATGKNKRPCELVSSGVVPGLAGCLGGSPVSWISLAGEEANGSLRAANVLPAGTLASPPQPVMGES